MLITLFKEVRDVINGKAGKAAALPKVSAMLALFYQGGLCQN